LKKSKARQYIEDRLALVRVKTFLGVAIEVATGAQLSDAVITPGVALRVACAAVLAGAITACVNTVNDILDVESDTLNKPHRPLPSGRVTSESATRFAVVLGVLGLGLAVPLGAAAFAVAVLLLVAGLCYCFWTRSTVVLGNVLVAVLAGSPIMYGAYVAGRVNAKVVIATGLLMIFMAAFEVLKTFRDGAVDRVAGYTTLATRYGRRHSLGLFTGLVVTLSGVYLLPLAVAARPGYFIVMGIGAIAPTLVATVFLLHKNGHTNAVLLVLRMMGYFWWPGLLAFWFM
jgi:geranylgeranylglycerol-phosphate geranylgeranyltransferase